MRLLDSADARWYRLGEELYPGEIARPTRAEQKRADKKA